MGKRSYALLVAPCSPKCMAMNIVKKNWFGARPDPCSCLDCGADAEPFEVLKIDTAGRRQIRFLCSCGMVVDTWEMITPNQTLENPHI